ncbi:hypothetical protein ScPMuIL_001336 [Solemya velum]
MVGGPSRETVSVCRERGNTRKRTQLTWSYSWESSQPKSIFQKKEYRTKKNMAVKRNELDEVEPTSLWCSTRLGLAFVSFLGFVNLYALRVNMSVAMVCMVNQTALEELKQQAKTTVNDTVSFNSTFTTNTTGSEGIIAVDSGCVLQRDGNGTASSGEFVWEKSTQGYILSSFFYGYIITQLPGGWLSSRFGGKHIFGWSMLVCALCTLFMPLAARTSVAFLIVLRVICGMCQGVVWPAMQGIWARWAPPLEINKLCGFCYAGSQIGNVLTFPLAALLCEYGFDGGWPSVFYVFGSLGVLWFVAWMYFVADSPTEHPRISEGERYYINKSLHGKISDKKAESTPWVAILTSVPVWAIIVTHTCANWGTYTFLTNIPTYMKEVLKFDIKKNGLLSALPYISFFIVINISGNIADALRARKVLSSTLSRKIFNSLGLGLPAVFVVSTGFIDCTQSTLAVVLLTIGVGMSGFQYGGGFLANPAEIAPKYAGIIFGFSNTVATIPGFMAPLAIGLITKDQTQEQWQIVFVVAAVVYILGVIFYIFTASGELQPWGADIPDDVEIKMFSPDQESKASKDIVKREGRIPETETLMQNSKM